MIKIVSKKGKMKVTLKGEGDVVGKEAAHAAIRMVENLIEADKAIGYATRSTIIEVLSKIVPELKKDEEEKENEE